MQKNEQKLQFSSGFRSLFNTLLLFSTTLHFVPVFIGGVLIYSFVSLLSVFHSNKFFLLMSPEYVQMLTTTLLAEFGDVWSRKVTKSQ
jgi:hypothetical protein